MSTTAAPPTDAATPTDAAPPTAPKAPVAPPAAVPAITRWAHPTSLGEALAELAVPGSVPAAGCTQLAFALADPRRRPGRLVALGGVPELSAVQQMNWADGRGTVVLGAAVTHARVAADADLRAAVPLLGDVFSRVGNVRVRSVATVGGVLAGAVYAWDPPTVLHALDARVRLDGPNGRRTVAVEDFYPAGGTTVIEPGELLTSVEIDVPPPGTVSRYLTLKTRSAEDSSALGVAVVLGFDPSGVCVRARLALGSATARPVTFTDLDALLLGEGPGSTSAKAVADGYADRVTCVDDLRAGAAYRVEMVRVYVRRAIAAAYEAGAA
ncbi:xanthine dehydrogenase family protein subunit M [Parafrankia sp. EUN1f]|uniref:FAD binding domain-containing protein n=1 Tax=Parafrankia sp. EUN1f TaxID=102897 RepID=UPI0001C4474E|nr:FAD binding domain-containing protein [Parafrankia sp. EUN1f]EFC82915.1 molybdopterin dehydrogenase FAD-binding [Parafrankia sp. EUN1f]